MYVALGFHDYTIQKWKVTFWKVSNKNMVYVVYLIILIDNAQQISEEKRYISGYGLFFPTAFIDLML